MGKGEVFATLIFIVIIATLLAIGVMYTQKPSSGTLTSPTTMKTSETPTGGISMPKKIGVFLFKDGKFVDVSTGKPWVPDKEGVVVAYFKQIECGACRYFDPEFIKFCSWLKESGPKGVKVYIISASELKPNPDYIIESFLNHEIQATPTVVFFKDGREADRIVGAVGFDKLKETLLSILE
ncbi:MAG TPA: thioredoxin [Acidilobales archaeon]|nr:MAG: hypothetical protein DRO18_05805 [Thermoprotei archaeon]HDD25694.1 thioredoxin [Acidilobales archaeon]